MTVTRLNSRSLGPAHRHYESFRHPRLCPADVCPEGMGSPSYNRYCCNKHTHLLTAFPLDHKRMQTVLLAREIARMMRWDGDSKGDVNRHFASVTELHRTMGYIGNLSIDKDVLKSVLMATLKASTNRSLRDSYHNDKDLYFALIQDACVRQFRHHPDERHPAAWSRDLPGTPLRNQGPHGSSRTTLNKT